MLPPPNLLRQRLQLHCKTATNLIALKGLLPSRCGDPVVDEAGAGGGSGVGSSSDHAALQATPTKVLSAEAAEATWSASKEKLKEKMSPEAVAEWDISHAVNDLARVAHNPGLAHVRALQHVSRYLATTPRMGLLYKKPTTLAESYPVGWTDANYAPSYNTGVDSHKDNYRSTSAYIFTCNGTAVTWRSRRQQVLATSSCDSETYAAAAAAKEAVHLRRLLAMPDEASPPVVLLGDNKSSIKAAENGTDKDRSKHIDVSAHFLRERCRDGSICFFYVPGTENVSDMLSKNLHTPSFNKFRAGMGVS